MMKVVLSIGFGSLFGAILIASEAFQWNRIQEMFHFESFHMFGLLFSAIGTGFVSLQIIKRFRIKSVYGNEIQPKPKPRKRVGNVIGGLVFGSGWAITGACTAPLFIVLGYKWQVGLLILVGAIVGVLFYGLIRSKIPE